MTRITMTKKNDTEAVTEMVTQDSRMSSKSKKTLFLVLFFSFLLYWKRQKANVHMYK